MLNIFTKIYQNKENYADIFENDRLKNITEKIEIRYEHYYEYYLFF